MFKLELFLGVQVNKEIQRKLDACNPHLLKTFIKNDSDYLHQAFIENKKYLGKNLGELCSLDRFDFLCTNVYSILKRLIDSPCETYPLLILAIPKDEKN